MNSASVFLLLKSVPLCRSGVDDVICKACISSCEIANLNFVEATVLDDQKQLC